MKIKKAEETGLEPASYGMTNQHSNQLSYSSNHFKNEPCEI